jgi:predicted acetyltransferase
MNVELAEVTEDNAEVVRNLSRYYVYDLSEYTRWLCRADGVVGCRDFDDYWTLPGHAAFIVKVDGEPAGFALVDDKGNAPETQYNVGEFFIMRKHRRRGVGEAVARRLFDRFRGRWEVRQLLSNTPASAFWRKVVARYTGGRFEESVEHVEHLGIEMVVQRFSSAADA